MSKRTVAVIPNLRMASSAFFSRRILFSEQERENVGRGREKIIHMDNNSGDDINNNIQTKKEAEE